MKNHLHTLNNNKTILFLFIIYFFFSIAVGDLIMRRLGHYNLLEFIPYFFIQINFFTFLIVSVITAIKDKTIKKGMFSIIYIFYYFLIFIYIAYVYWHDRSVIQIIKFLSIQALICIFLYRRYELFKYKNKLLKNSLIFLSLSVIGMSYSYYKHTQFMNFCKTVTTEKDSLYCLKKLNIKMGYTDNMVGGKYAAILFSNNTKFKEHIERVMRAKVVVKDNDVEWHPIHTPIK